MSSEKPRIEMTVGGMQVEAMDFDVEVPEIGEKDWHTVLAHAGFEMTPGSEGIKILQNWDDGEAKRTFELRYDRGLFERLLNIVRGIPFKKKTRIYTIVDACITQEKMTASPGEPVTVEYGVIGKAASPLITYE